ncbi:hypothetical protein LUZ63_015717 [Rhynchospora breviuscula]|uniref:F-box domain-containing protein n=1 Tax=Rhynchospora breviuscula TaxID=2022672 RepID=A0A9Q0CCU1_9POAL|nr:hypothetical protein LUZ63_015717 [Rhynchospora breviuscula]
MAAGNRSRRWSNLPSDLIHLISTKLPDLSDRVRIRAVCKMWKSSVSASDPSPCLPWFVSSEMDGTDEFVYYCLSSKKTCTIHCPQQRNSHIHGTAGGFILCCKDRHTCPQSISLFNPLTGLEISVPKPKESKKFSVVSNPFQKDLVVILGLQDSKNFVGLIRPGDDAWVIRRLDMMLYEELCVWYNGTCYIKEYGIPPWIGDATTRSVLSTVPLPPPPAPRGPHPILKPRYMLETCGEILLIFMHSTSICELEEIYFSIYRLNKMGEEENYQWVKVRGIGDRMLFLDNVRSFVLKASDFSGFTRNCIYFQSYDYKRLRFLLCRHDLDTGTTKVLPNFSGKYWSTWMIPNLSKSN